MLTQDERKKLKLDAMMSAPLHDHRDTMLLKDSKTLNTSDAAKAEGHASKVIVRTEECHVCGHREQSTKTLWSTTDQHIQTK